MTLDFKKARELCTEPEFALVAASRPSALRSMTPRLLRLKMARARGLRDKFRANARTAEKAKLFGEVLRRFEVRARTLDVGAKTGRVPRPARAKRSAGPVRRGQKRWEAADARKEAKLKRSPVPRLHSHVSSRNRRGQARRDAR
jgi:hypothetical protein